MTTPTTVADLRAIGPFPGVIQIAPTFGDHELLSDPTRAGGTVAPLTFHGGRTITAPRVVLVFLDAFPDDKADFTAFVTALVQNGYYISPDASDTANGTFVGAVSMASGLTGTATDAQLQALVDTNAGKGLPASDPNTLYLLILPPSLQVSMDNSASCTAFCGYHSKSVGGNYYAVICDPSCEGCHGSLTPQQGRQMITSHEYGEWRSDPDGTGWYNDQSGQEDGDECAWQPVPWGPGVASPSTEEGAQRPQGAAGAVWTVQPLAVNGKGCGDVPPYQPSATPQPTPQPQPQPALSISGPASLTVDAFATFTASLTPADASALYDWYCNGDPMPTWGYSATATITPSAAGPFIVTCRAITGSQSVSSNTLMLTVAAAPQPQPQPNTDGFWDWLVSDGAWCLTEPESQRAQQATIVRQTLDQFYPPRHHPREGSHAAGDWSAPMTPKHQHGRTPLLRLKGKTTEKRPGDEGESPVREKGPGVRS